jgi:hypothetical protein
LGLLKFCLCLAAKRTSAAEGGKMRTTSYCALTLGVLLLLVGGATAFGDGMAVKITNNTTDDVVVTVYDMSTQPYRVILMGTRISGFTSVPISVLTDETGKANLGWTATNVDSSSRKCGHNSQTGVGDSESVNVYANSECRS